MSIKSNAASDEANSPFYIANKKLCEVWESFIKSKNGKINAVFNAWSLNIKAKVKAEKTWLISVKKATYTSGNLLLSSKSQNLQEILEFQARFNQSNCPDFRIVKSRWKSKVVQHELCCSVAEFLKKEEQGKDVISANFTNGLLTLTFHHRNDDFQLVERVLKFQN